MKNLKIFASVVGMLFTFCGQAQDSINPNPIDTNLYNDWILIKYKELPKDTGYISIKGGPYGELILNSNGTFKTINGEQSTAGRWNIKSDTLGILINEIDNKPWESRDYSYNRRIVKITEKEMILVILGRHGPLFYKYIPKTKTN